MATGDVTSATEVPAAEAAGVSTETTAVASAETTVATSAAVTSAMLGPDGDCQEKRERHDGHQAAHMGLV